MSLEYDLASRRWFHPHITGVEAEKLLKSVGEDGSFLCRRSQDDSTKYTISILRDDDVVHLRMQNTNGYYSLFGEEQFVSPFEVVEHCLDNPGMLKEKSGSIIELKQPVTTQDAINYRWYHGNISATEAETLMLDKGQHGSYLVRSSYHTPGDYVLSVRLKDQVTHVKIHGRGKQYDVGGGKQFDSIEDLIEYYKKCLLVDDKGIAIYLYQPCHCTRFIPAFINERVAELKKTNWVFTKTGFWEEFERLQQLEFEHLHTYSRLEGARPENKSKNRYKHVIPYDYTRVVLEPPGGDYINASYIKGEVTGSIRGDYIATQGCLQDTVIDFWRMLYQVKSHIIVMVTNEMEHGRIKCARYWPNKGEIQEFGQFVVHCVLEDHSRPHYILREFHVRCVTDPTQRKLHRVHQYHFTAWPDHSTPDDPSTVLSFLQDIRSQRRRLAGVSKKTDSPMIVHCCNGLGRTGALIVIDIVLNILQSKGLHNEIDIWNSVQLVRTQRPGMVQTDLQYKFVYMTIMDYVNKCTLLSRRVSSLHSSDASLTSYKEVSPVSSSPVDAAVSRIDWGVPQKAILYVMKCPIHGGKEMAANHRGSSKKKCTCDTSSSIGRGNTVRAYRDSDTIKLDLGGSINDPNCMFNYYTTNIPTADHQHSKSASTTATEVLYALECTGPGCEGHYLHWDTTTEPYRVVLKKDALSNTICWNTMCWRMIVVVFPKDRNDHRTAIILQAWTPNNPPCYLAFTSDSTQPYLTTNQEKASRLGTIVYNDM